MVWVHKRSAKHVWDGAKVMMHEICARITTTRQNIMNSRQHWLGPSKTRHDHLYSGLEDGVAEGLRSSMVGEGGVGGGQ